MFNADVQSNNNYSLIWVSTDKLLKACQNGHLRVVEKLISSNAPVAAMVLKAMIYLEQPTDPKGK
jgi:hypothetical protein